MKTLKVELLKKLIELTTKLDGQIDKVTDDELTEKEMFVLLNKLNEFYF